MTNNCYSIIFDKNTFPNISIPQIQNSNSFTYDKPNIKCINGQELTDNKLCICYPGWVDDNSVLSNSILKCNKIIPGFTNSSSNQNLQVVTPNMSNIIFLPTNGSVNTNITPVRFIY